MSSVENGRLSRVDGGVQAGELREQSISEELHDPTALVPHDLPGDALEGLDQREGEILIVRRKSRIPCHIRKKDRSEATLSTVDRMWGVRSGSVRRFGHRATLG
jgi:hypothetical protein